MPPLAHYLNLMAKRQWNQRNETSLLGTQRRRHPAISTISSTPDLYAHGIQQTSVTVDGVSGTRLSGVQTEGQGGGPQVEYDFTITGRTYDFFAYVGGSPSSLEAGAPSASLFDQIVQTVTFTG